MGAALYLRFFFCGLLAGTEPRSGEILSPLRGYPPTNLERFLSI
jgi:hypothetical protein